MLHREPRTVGSSSRYVVIDVEGHGQVDFKLPNAGRQLELIELAAAGTQRSAGRLRMQGAGDVFGLILGECWFNKLIDLETPVSLRYDEPRAYGEAVLEELEEAHDLFLEDDEDDEDHFGPWDFQDQVGPTVQKLLQLFSDRIIKRKDIERQVGNGSRPAASTSTSDTKSESTGSARGRSRSKKSRRKKR